MTMTIIIKDEHGKQVEISVELDDGKNWEEKCYQSHRRKQQERPSFDLLGSQSDSYARGHLPALAEPRASRHWVAVLRNMTAN